MGTYKPGSDAQLGAEYLGAGALSVEDAEFIYKTATEMGYEVVYFDRNDFLKVTCPKCGRMSGCGRGLNLCICGEPLASVSDEGLLACIGTDGGARALRLPMGIEIRFPADSNNEVGK